MKAFLLLSYSLFIGSAFAQPFTEIGKTYEFSGNVLLPQCTAVGATTGLSNVLEEYWLFTVVKEIAGGDKIVFVEKFTSEPALNSTYFKADAAGQPTVYFLIKAADFAAIKRIPEAQWAFGTVLMPLKLRFGKNNEDGSPIRYFDFTSEVNIGLSLARRLSKRQAVIKTYMIGSIGTTAIPVDSFTTGGKVSTKTSLAAFSPTLGLLLNFKDSGFQLVISSGLDIIPGDVGRSWVYRNAPFLGIGAGFSIFNFGNRNTN